MANSLAPLMLVSSLNSCSTSIMPPHCEIIKVGETYYLELDSILANEPTAGRYILPREFALSAVWCSSLHIFSGVAVGSHLLLEIRKAVGLK